MQLRLGLGFKLPMFNSACFIQKFYLVNSDTRSTERWKELQSFPPRNHLN